MINQKEKISIIIPVKNEEDNIGLLLDALQRQTYPFDEIVITDGGSTDRTRDIIKLYSLKDERIKLIAVKKSSCEQGRNIAIKNSTGSILALIDSGIIPNPDWIEKLIYPMINDSSISCVFGHVIFDTRSRIKPISDLQRTLVLLTKPNEEQDWFYVPGSAMMRSIWEDLKGFPQGSETGEDLVLINLIKKKGYKYIYAKDAISYYYDYPNSMMDIFKKWIFHTKGTTTICISVKYFLIKLILFLLSFIFVVILSLLALKNMKLGLFLIVYLFIVTTYRLAQRVIIHKSLSTELLKRPQNWLLMIKMFFLLDLARIIGIFKGFFELLKCNSKVVIDRKK